MSARTVLHEADISRALTRIAHEILESNRGAENLVLLGIPTRGVTPVSYTHLTLPTTPYV